MGGRFNMDELEKEVRELILHSKSRRTTVFEPCNKDNISECLQSVQDELSIQGIKCFYDPSAEIEGSENTINTLVRLLNATWNLVMQHKEIACNADKLKERNYALQQNNFYLNNMVDRLKNESQVCESKAKQVEESRRQAIQKLDITQKELAKTNEELKRSKKLLISKEDHLTKQIKKVERDYIQFQDRTRRSTGSFVSKNEGNNLYIEEFKIREKKYKETIAKLQETNKHLLLEVISLKDDLVSSDKEEFE